MTVIVGIVTEGSLVMAGDAAAAEATGAVHRRAEAKVFVRDGYAIGFTTSFRMGQILRYEVKLPEPPKVALVEELHAFMVQSFVPTVRETFKEHGFTKELVQSTDIGLRSYGESGQEVGGRFLVGVQGVIFVIDGDFHVGRPTARYASIGSGSQVAHGALFALSETVPANERAQKALEAAAEHTSGVRPPFTIIEL